MKKIADPINKRVRDRRKELRLTQEEVAKSLNMKRTTYSRMEKEGTIRPRDLLDLAYILKTDVNYLLYGKENEFLKEPKKHKEPIILKTSVAEIHEDPLISTITNREKNAVIMLRNMRKEDREEIYRIIKEFHDKKFKKN